MNSSFFTILALCLMTSFSMTPVKAYSQVDTECCAETSAYDESCSVAYWTASVPLVILLGAAVFFGMVDGNSTGESSHASQDGLGSLGGSSSSRLTSGTSRGSSTHNTSSVSH